MLSRLATASRRALPLAARFASSSAPAATIARSGKIQAAAGVALLAAAAGSALVSDQANGALLCHHKEDVPHFGVPG